MREATEETLFTLVAPESFEKIRVSITALLPYRTPLIQALAILPDVLKRARETVPQTTLRKTTREENMQGAFAANVLANPDATYIVIDGVITTDATLHAAHTALKAAGAEHIMLLALAH